VGSVGPIASSGRGVPATRAPSKPERYVSRYASYPESLSLPKDSSKQGSAMWPFVPQESPRERPAAFVTAASASPYLHRGLDRGPIARCRLPRASLGARPRPDSGRAVRERRVPHHRSRKLARRRTQRSPTHGRIRHPGGASVRHLDEIESVFLLIAGAARIMLHHPGSRAPMRKRSSGVPGGMQQGRDPERRGKPQCKEDGSIRLRS
jgi:hypothetical protein